MAQDHAIDLFEKDSRLGGHTHTHSIKEEGTIYNVDSGFIVYNENTYPNFIKLLDSLDVKRQHSSMGFSVKSYNKDFEYSGNSLSAVFSKKSNLLNPYFLNMQRSIIRFNKNSVKDLETMNESTLLIDYLKSKNYSDYFITYYIIPMAASIWSTSPNFILEMPAIFFIRFFDNHGLLKITNRPQWWVIKNGSKQYVKKILDDFNGTIHLNTTINELKRESNKVYIKINNDTKIFDAVVLATHSDQSLSIIKDLSDNEKNVLGKIKYQKNTALIHTDTSILPKRKKAWSSWNYLLDKNDNKVILTYNMNILQSLKSKKTYCVTLNNTDMINENKIIKKITYHHPLFTKESVYAQSQKNLICGVNNTYFCGAYWGNGFHEDGVNSALDVCKKFGIDL